MFYVSKKQLLLLQLPFASFDNGSKNTAMMETSADFSQ